MSWISSETVRSTTGPLSDGNHTFHIRTHSLKVVKTSLNYLFNWTKNINTKQKEKRDEFNYKKNPKYVNVCEETELTHWYMTRPEHWTIWFSFTDGVLQSAVVLPRTMHITLSLFLQPQQVQWTSPSTFWLIRHHIAASLRLKHKDTMTHKQCSPQVKILQQKRLVKIVKVMHRAVKKHTYKLFWTHGRFLQYVCVCVCEDI